jgi:tryptophan halogenase
MPTAWDPLADAMDAAEMQRQLQSVREQVQSTAVRMSTHEEFLAKYCPATPPSMGARA